MHTDHNTPPSSEVNPEALKLGHEPDKVNVRTILYVPITLIIVFAATFGVVVLIFNYMRHSTTSSMASNNPVAAQRHEASLNDRLTRIGEQQQDDSVSRQPRLDGLDQLNTKDGGDRNDPSYMRSFSVTKSGNSPSYHPEDMRPSSEHGKVLGLQSFAWKDKDKGLIRMPIEDVLKLLAEKTFNEKTLKSSGKNLDEIQESKPKSSNPAWGIIKTKTDVKTENKEAGH